MVVEVDLQVDLQVEVVDLLTDQPEAVLTDLEGDLQGVEEAMVGMEGVEMEMEVTPHQVGVLPPVKTWMPSTTCILICSTMSEEMQLKK
jgi:hypothetical protein